jgi:phosphatidylglycerol:prolipoprotein diacylglycerol transferase
MLDAVHPVLFKVGALLIPSYGVLAAAGVLLALFLAQRTARKVRISPHHIWNVCVLALCSGLLGSRLLLIAVNWRDLLQHPLWMLGLAMIHNPLVAAAGAAAGIIAAALYARVQRMPLLATLDALAAPVALATACEQAGTLLAGSGYGTETSVPWRVTYTSTLAARWSGAPLGVAVHPVQAYAALGFLSLAVLLLIWLPVRRQAGDVAGLGLMGAGVVVFVTELWRDPEGRGSVFGGFMNIPQIVAVMMVMAGALILRERAPQPESIPPQREPLGSEMEDAEAKRA